LFRQNIYILALPYEWEEVSKIFSMLDGKIILLLKN